MQRKKIISLMTMASAVAFLWGNVAENTTVFVEQGRVAIFAEEPQDVQEDFSLGADEEEDLPLVLSDVPEEQEGEVAPAAVPEKDEPQVAPQTAEETPELELPPLDSGAAPIDEEEMRQLSNQPFFKEFSDAVGNIAPLPDSVNVEDLAVPGAELFLNNGQQIELHPDVSNADAVPTQSLDEVLEIANVDLDALNIHNAALDRLDAEITRLSALWIEAELNKTTVGRRERDWRQNDLSRYSSEPSVAVDVPGNDWALAPDVPFFFQVVDSLTGETFYTKAGDFEQIDGGDYASVGLIREGRNYLLTVEPGKVAPTGRAVRVRILKNGQIQGVDAEDKLITDVNLGNVCLYLFDNPARLESQDGVFFTPSPLSGAPKLAILPPHTKSGVSARKVLLSNGKPNELFARIVVLCKSKKRFVEILTQPRSKNAVSGDQTQFEL